VPCHSLNIPPEVEHLEDVPELMKEAKELRLLNKLFPRVLAHFDPSRVVQLASDLQEQMSEHALTCDGRGAEHLDDPHLALWCSVGMLRHWHQLCFGDEVYTFSPEAELPRTGGAQ
jgi:hypothetical protein